MLMNAITKIRPAPSRTAPPARRGPKAATGNGSLHGEVLQKLREYVVEGNLGEGERIPEKQLCEMLGISRTPLREALKVLASEGLIDLLPNRGARIRSLNRDQLSELFDIMGGLEALAGRLACQNITDAEIAEIERIHHDMYGSYLRRDLHRYFECNQMIHERILKAARNDRLTQTYHNFADQLRRMRYNANQARKRDRWGEAMREHEEMLDALHRRAGNEMSDILFRHLHNKAVAVLDNFEEAAPAGEEALVPQD
jgi:DNA-binding GntR family transcriptional regulator